MIDDYDRPCDVNQPDWEYAREAAEASDDSDDDETVDGMCELCHASPILVATGLCSQCTMEML